MAASDRKRTSKDIRRSHIRWLKGLLLENPMPTCDGSFWDSEWHRWLSRIEEGKTAELQHLDNVPGDIQEDVGEMYAEDIAHADAISNDMYAAMCVHIWSKFEKLLDIA